MEREREFNCSISCSDVFRIEMVGSGETSLRAAFRMKSTMTVKAISILK